MRIEVLKPAELTPDQLAAWSRLQVSDPALRSPFFRPEFTLTVAGVRSDVEVAVVEEPEGAVGFFPYQRGPGNVAHPVGERFSDYHGMVARAHLKWNPLELLEACRLSAWSFDHLPAGQLPFQPYHRRQTSSPYMDVSSGFESYRSTRVHADSDEITQALRKGRKAGREVGPVRLETNGSPALLDTLLSWKRQQFQRTGAVDVLRPDWTQQLLRSTVQCQTPDFSGKLLTLYFGDRVAALHLMLQSHGVLHSWFPAYDVELQRYSPGLLLILELAQHAEELGLRTIDLGKGDEPYKQRLMTAAVPLAEGFVERRRVRSAVKGALWGVRNWVRHSRLRQPAKALAGRLAPWYSRLARRGA